MITPETKITKDFKYKEFFCKDGSQPPLEYYNYILMCATELQKVRDIIKKPIIITSAYRTKEWNAKNGGARNSLHLRAMAVDSRASGMTLTDYLMYLIRFSGFGGIGINIKKNFIHCDLRSKFTIIHY